MKPSDLKNPDFPNFREESMHTPDGVWFRELTDSLVLYSRLAAEFGHAEESARIIGELRDKMEACVAEYRRLTATPKPDMDEPDDLAAIQAARPDSRRTRPSTIPRDYRERWFGSFLGRGAGCTLGAGLEFHSVDDMERWARYFDVEYPLKDYWPRVKDPYTPRYIVGCKEELCRGRMDALPADDDTGYTLIGLLTLEEHGPDFTREQLAETWLRHISLQGDNGSWGCYWGERKFIQNLLEGVPAEHAGHINNPYVTSIAAWTRADAWGYAAPGWPEKAAALAFKDASCNHRRHGVYGEMFFAAAISAAFVVDHPVTALQAGLNEIPRNCLFADAMRWALDVAPKLQGYRDGAKAVRERYAGMFHGNAINNACFTVIAIARAGTDLTKAIGEATAMGMDNDCTAATAGSIIGAVIGKKNIPPHWYECFQNRMHSSLKNSPEYLGFDELFERFEKQAKLLIEHE